MRTLDELCNLLSTASAKTLAFFDSTLRQDGSYGEKATDIAYYFKSPLMFALGDKPDKARLILNYLEKNFLMPDGDFMTSAKNKSEKGEYAEFWTYSNGWIVRAAQKVGLDDLVEKANGYLKKYHQEPTGGFLTHEIGMNGSDGITDVLTTAHFGLIHLESGNMPVATKAGDYLCDTLQMQPNLDQGFLLRRNGEGQLITSFDEKMSVFYTVKHTEPGQLYFMIGYPAAYLATLYQATKNDKYLAAAKHYTDFALSSHEDVLKSNFSHKVMWACSILHAITEEEKYLAAVEQLSQHFMKQQQATGAWYGEDITAYDQSAEIACWFMESAKQLQSLIQQNTAQAEIVQPPQPATEFASLRP